MAIKERYQSATLNDTIKLDLYAYQNNSLEDVSSFEKIEVYFLDPFGVTDTNLDGRELKTTILPASITRIGTGHYQASLFLDDSLYEVGDFIDVWYTKFNSYDNFLPITNQFKVYTDLRVTVDRPFVYDITFSSSPKKIIAGSKKYIKASFFPTIPVDNNTWQQFYFNLKTTSNMFIRIEMIEGCGYNEKYPEANIKTDPEWEQVEIRGDNEAYYLLDTTEDTGIYPIGIYWIQFKILIDGQEILSEKFYLQILD